jgi:ribokinase
VGDDGFGEDLVKNFTANDVITTYVEPVTHLETGTAHITLADDDNSIIVVKGANNYVTPDFVEKALGVILESDIVLIQQEIPEETVEYVTEICFANDVPLLLNPAPARPISKTLIEKATYITPNEWEASVLFENKDIHDALKEYPNKLLVTEGKNGVRYYDGVNEVLVPAYVVDAVDTTGAGDTFNAAFAVGVAEGKSIKDSIRFANRAASLSVTKFGAQGGMPTRVEVERSI